MKNLKNKKIVKVKEYDNLMNLLPLFLYLTINKVQILSLNDMLIKYVK